jgi:hypothetical protein
MAMKVQVTAEELLVNAGLDTSVWGIDIIKAEGIGFFTLDMEIRAGSWTSCACGEMNSWIATDEAGVPTDRKLRNLGNTFTSCVRFDHIRVAAESLIAIEARAIELLHEVA